MRTMLFLTVVAFGTGLTCFRPAVAHLPEQAGGSFVARDNVQSSSLSFRFGPSIAPAGENAVLSVEGRVVLDFRRLSSANDPARISIVLRDAVGREINHWTLVPPVRQVINVTGKELRELDIHVEDEIEAGDNWVDSLMLHATALDRNSAVTLKRGHSVEIHSDLLKASCSSAADLSDDDASALVARNEFDLAELNSDVADIQFIPGGKKIVLSVASFSPKQAGSIDVNIFFKTVLGSFARACAPIRLVPGDKQHIIVASLVQSHPRLVWRIETTVTKAKPSDRLPMPAQIRHSIEEASPLGLEARAKLEGYLCRSISSYRGKTDDGKRQFATKVRLSVDVHDPTFPLSSAQRAKLAETILDAVQLWIAGCNTCRPDHLLVVEIDNSLYANAGVFLLSDSSLNNPKVHNVTPSNGEIEDMLKLLMLGIPMFPGFGATYPTVDLPLPMMFSFRRITSAEKFSRLCARSTSAGSTPILHNIQRVVCNPAELDSSLTAKIRVRFRQGRTACGDDENTIACRADEELTEYNARDYSFRTDDPAVSIGRGSTRLDLVHVLAHEIGHWIGLEHISEGDSIMAGSYEQSRCIGARDARAITADHSSATAGPTAFTLRASKKAVRRAGP